MKNQTKKNKLSQVNNNKIFLKSKISGGAPSKLILLAAGVIAGSYLVYNTISKKVEKIKEIKDINMGQFTYLAQNFLTEAGYFGERQEASLFRLINYLVEYQTKGKTSLDDISSLLSIKNHVPEITQLDKANRNTMQEFEFPKRRFFSLSTVCKWFRLKKLVF